LRSEAAWALPRPSAIASAKFAKSTVNQSQSVTPKMKPADASPRPPAKTACPQSRVVRMEPTYTTNITGFRTWRWGVSFLNESMVACHTMGRSKSGRALSLVAMDTDLTWPTRE